MLTSDARPGARDISAPLATGAPSAGTTRPWGSLVALGAISAVSRLPQLLSPNLLLDGDECTLGLMAKHLAQGKEFPIFFYGQHYGLSSIEAGAGALSFVLFGTGAVPLKLAMLALWTMGVLFLFLALSKLLGASRSFWIAAVLVLHPAWAVWSMKARGGYITAFTATAALMWLVAHDRRQDRTEVSVARWLMAGALTAVIYLAQPLWLPGALPILVAVLVSRRRLAGAVAFFSVAAAAVLFVGTGELTTFVNSDLVGALPAVAQRVYVNLTGAYYLWWAGDPPGPATKILALVWCGVLPAAALMQLYRMLTRRYCPLAHLLFLSVCATLFTEWVLIHARDARYLLPLGALLVLLAGVEVADLVDRRLLSKRTAFGLTLAALLLGSLSMREFRDFTYLWTNPPGGLSEARRLRQVITYLKTRDVRHAFSMNGLLEWQLMFYSGEEVLARYAAPTDRYPRYVSEVDRALAHGEPIAVVGYTSASGAPGCSNVPVCTGGIEAMVANPEAIFTVDDKYFAYAGASRELLQKLGFQLPD
jgi:hypothetical protein